jgi:transposase
VPIPDPTSRYGVRIEYLRLPRTETEREFRGVFPRRWVVECTFSWLGQSRWLSKDYERLCETGEALIYATMGRLMVRRLARG